MVWTSDEAREELLPGAELIVDDCGKKGVLA